MKDREGTTWVQIRLSEYHRDALIVAHRLVRLALKEHDVSSTVWAKGSGKVNPQAVLINLDSMIESWDLAAEDESHGH